MKLVDEPNPLFDVPALRNISMQFPIRVGPMISARGAINPAKGLDTQNIADTIFKRGFSIEENVKKFINENQ